MMFQKFRVLTHKFVKRCAGFHPGGTRSVASATGGTQSIASATGGTRSRASAWKAAILAVAVAAGALFPASASVTDLGSYQFRYDFSKGTYSFIGDGTDYIVAKSATNPDSFIATDGPNGPGSAVYVNNSPWGESFGTSDNPTTLNANWTLAMSFRPGQLDNGVVLSMGRLNAKNRKELAICSSSDPSKLYVRIIRNPSNSTSTALEKTVELTGLGNVTNGFHTLVIAHNKPSNNKGTLYFYWDGVSKGSYTMTTDVPFGNGIQFNILLTKSAGYGCVRSDTADAGLRARFYDVRFYTGQFDSNDAIAYAAQFPCTYPLRPDAYVEANGCNGIDTEHFAIHNSTRYVADYMYLSPKGQTRILIAEGNLISALYVQGSGATGNLGWNVNNTGWTGTGKTTGRLRRTATLDTLNRVVGITNHDDRASFYTSTTAMKSASADATETTLLFGQRKNGERPLWNMSKARIYSFEIGESGALSKFLAPATNEVGEAGFRDILTGNFHGEYQTNNVTRALRFYNGVGCADDYKYESGTLYAKCYASSEDAEKGTVKFGSGAAAGSLEEWLPYGGGETLTATPAAGYVFAGWKGDTWLIVNGSARDAIITVSGERASQLFATFERSSSPVSSYAQSGTAALLAHFDGIENLAAGMHQDGAPTWTDLTGNLTLTKTGSAGFSADAWTADGSSCFLGESDAVKDALTAKTFTLEMVISHPSSQNDYENWVYIGDPSGSSGSQKRQLVVDLRKNDSSNQLVQGLQYRANKWVNGAKITTVDAGMKWETRQYIAVVCNGDNAAVGYYDGTNQFWSTSGTVNPASNLIGVGATSVGGSMLYSGSEICAVRMTSRALNADELMRNWYVDSQRFGLETVPDGYRFTEGVLEVRVTSGVAGFELSTDGGTTWTTEEIWKPIDTEVTLTARYITDPTLAIFFGGTPSDAVVSGSSVTFTPTRPLEVTVAMPSLDLSGSAVWGEAAWKLGETSITAPTNGSALVNLTDGDATLTLDEDVALDSLRVVGGGTLTIVRGAHTYTVASIDAASGTRMLVSLSGGKILIEYTASGFLVQTLYMTPDPEETLVLSGETLNFAAGAKIYPGAGGELGGTSVIASSFTTAGALEILGVTNVTPLAAADMSKLTFAVSAGQTLALPSLSGEGVEVTFDANAFGEPTDGEAASAATVKANGANTMTDSAFVVRGDAAHPIVYDVAAKYALPPVIDFWGDASLTFSVAGGYNDGVTKGTDAITMHPGTVLTNGKGYVFHYASGEVVLDGASMTHSAGTTYIYYLTLSNAASASVTGGAFQFGYTADEPTLKVSGDGASTFNGYFTVVGKNQTTGVNNVTIDVEDTVAGDGVDFVVNGDISSNASYPATGFIKVGEGTMRLDGVATFNQPIQLREGTLLLNRAEGSMAAGNQVSLQGGTLALAAGTSNEVASVELTASSAMTFGADASFVCADLTVPDGSTLNLAGDLRHTSLRVTAALDAATLRRIRCNGVRAKQDADGYIRTARGFVIIVK